MNAAFDFVVDFLKDSENIELGRKRIYAYIQEIVLDTDNKFDDMAAEYLFKFLGWDTDKLK